MPANQSRRDMPSLITNDSISVFVGCSQIAPFMNDPVTVRFIVCIPRTGNAGPPSFSFSFISRMRADHAATVAKLAGRVGARRAERPLPSVCSSKKLYAVRVVAHATIWKIINGLLPLGFTELRLWCFHSPLPCQNGERLSSSL